MLSYNFIHRNINMSATTEEPSTINENSQTTVYDSITYSYNTGKKTEGVEKEPDIVENKTGTNTESNKIPI